MPSSPRRRNAVSGDASCSEDIAFFLQTRNVAANHVYGMDVPAKVDRWPNSPTKHNAASGDANSSEDVDLFLQNIHQAVSRFYGIDATAERHPNDSVSIGNPLTERSKRSGSPTRRNAVSGDAACSEDVAFFLQTRNMASNHVYGMDAPATHTRYPNNPVPTGDRRTESGKRSGSPARRNAVSGDAACSEDVAFFLQTRNANANAAYQREDHRDDRDANTDAVPSFPTGSSSESCAFSPVSRFIQAFFAPWAQVFLC